MTDNKDDTDKESLDLEQIEEYSEEEQNKNTEDKEEIEMTISNDEEIELAENDFNAANEEKKIQWTLTGQDQQNQIF